MSSSRWTGSFRVCLALGLLAGGPAGASEPSVALKPRFDGATECYVEIDTELVQKMTGPDGKPMEITSRSLYGLLQKSRARGSAVEFEATIDRMLGAMAFSESMKSYYDTDDPDYEDASPMHRDTFGPVLNMPLKITVETGGEGPRARGVEGGEAIRRKLMDMGEQNFVAKSLSDTDFADSQIMSAFGETPLALYPPAPAEATPAGTAGPRLGREVAVGQTWTKTRKDDYPHVGRVIVRYDCKLDRVDSPAGAQTGGGDGRRRGAAAGSRIAVVSVTGTITKDADEKPPEGKRLGKIDGRFTGTAKFDIDNGRFLEIRRETQANVEVPPFWTRDPAAALLKIESRSTQLYTTSSVAERQRRKDEIARRVAEARARREAEEAAAMTGPVEPPTPANPPVPWLQWGGPHRNFFSEATGLANRWPKGGPPRLWERPLGDGFSAIVGDEDTLYTMYSARNKEDAFKGDEVVIALEARTGKTIWEHRYAAPWPKDLQMEFGPGPHSTPIVVGDRLFTVGCTARLLCLERKTGKVIWARDLLEEYKAELNVRGYGSSPLAYNGNILLPVSRTGGHAVMAFRQADGLVAWKGGDFEPGYASLLAIDAGGVPQLVAFSAKALLGLDPDDGSSRWSVDHPTQWGANISTPVWCGEDGHFFVSSAYGMGARGVKLENGGGKVSAREVWFNPKMKIHHGDAVRVGDWVYGSSGDFGPAFLACVNAKTGEFGWRQRGMSKANVLAADGKLIVLDEDGVLYLVKADPEKFRLLGKAAVCRKTAWTVPTLVGRTLYIRDREKIMALDLGPAKSST